MSGLDKLFVGKWLWHVQVSQSQAHGVQTGTLVDLGDTDRTGPSSQLSAPTTEVDGQGSVPSSSTGKPNDEDFDMFAQSRQSFEENLPRAKYVTWVVLVTLYYSFIVFTCVLWPYLPFFGRLFVKWFALCYWTVVCLSCLSVTLVYCAQTLALDGLGFYLVWR